MHKNRFTIFISILLAGLILAVGGVGLYTYRNLEKVVDQLQHESGPNYNLILLKDIMVSISGIENDMEAYLLTENQTYRNRYDQRIDDVNNYLDSLQRLNRQDPDFLRYTDSLKSLINKKVDILNQFQESISYNFSGTINEFAERMDQIPIETSNPDIASIPVQISDSVNITDTKDSVTTTDKKEKKGFLKSIISIFSKEKVPEDSILSKDVKQQVTTNPIAYHKPQTDSTFIAQKTNEYRSIFQNELYKLRQKSAIIGGEIKQKELELSQSQQTIQNQIIDLLTYLEEREINKIEIRSYKAKVIADETNDQVFIFSILTTILLFVTIIVVWSYFQKNKAYQVILRKATNDAKKLAKAKEQFLANMSHEIRTPMNAISGFTQQLLKTDLTPEQEEQLDIVNKSSEHLLHILNDVLDFSKLQAQKLRLDKTDFSLHELMIGTIKLMRQRAEEKKLKLHYTNNDIPEFVLGDPHRLRQILINLISNSIKFTDKGEVNVSITTARKTKSKSFIEIIVQDTGIGIPKDQQDRIMLEFEQAGNASDNKGTGLGLSITKKMVALHGGKMKLKSVFGQGTEVIVSLPYEISKNTTSPPPKTVTPRDLKGINVLIADDEPYNLKLLATILNNDGIKWKDCKDGISALTMLKNEPFDIALLDIKMPGLTGYEVAEALRKSTCNNTNIPLIALTATVTKEEFDKCLEAGFNKVIRKPFKEEELFDAIAMVASNRESLVVRDEETDQDQINPTYSLDALHKMGDQYFVMEMIQTFMTSAEKSLINLNHTWKTKDWEGLGNEAHKLVAATRHLKANDLTDRLKKIELKASSPDPAISLEELNALLMLIEELNNNLSHHIKAIRT